VRSTVAPIAFCELASTGRVRRRVANHRKEIDRPADGGSTRFHAAPLLRKSWVEHAPSGARRQARFVVLDAKQRRLTIEAESASPELGKEGAEARDEAQVGQIQGVAARSSSREGVSCRTGSSNGGSFARDRRLIRVSVRAPTSSPSGGPSADALCDPRLPSTREERR